MENLTAGRPTIAELVEKSKHIRNLILNMCEKAGTGHVNSSYSCIELMVALYHGGILEFDPKNPKWNDRDRFILSKGQASPGLYVVLADLGFFPLEELDHFNRAEGIFGVHLQNTVPGVEITSGSLGHGFGVAQGIALAEKMDGKHHLVVTLLGDGECYEGSVWETAMLASHHRLNNLVAIVDRNYMCAIDFTEDVNQLEPLDKKWESFGWRVVRINGHSFEQIFAAFDGIRSRRSTQPLLIIADTVKGKGVGFMSDSPFWHSQAPKGKFFTIAQQELNENVRPQRQVEHEIVKRPSMRDAFWNKIYDLAVLDRNLILVSADQNSPTLDDDFRKKIPQQFLNVGIAEQNMVLVAAGLAIGGKKAFAHAIAPFITLRCYEHIKMQLSAMKIPVTLVGVGAGFSYPDSGPTHHTLEDLSIMRTLPNMLVHNISDDVMAAAFALIAYREQRPRYIRLDREACPNIHQADADFSSGVALLRDGDGPCIVATGNMVHRALAVAENLSQTIPGIRVVEIYTFPVNLGAFAEAIGPSKRVVTLEEHFLPGGLGSAVTEALADSGICVPVKRIGVDPSKGYCYRYGGRGNIQLQYGLDEESIIGKVSLFLQ
ncbi:MAG: transketolase C-terminal domain-containing protein [Minisyncoccia bacterium]|jgi:transketolase